MFELEREIVNENIISNPWFYNKRVGAMEEQGFINQIVVRKLVKRQESVGIICPKGKGMILSLKLKELLRW